MKAVRLFKLAYICYCGLYSCYVCRYLVGPEAGRQHHDP